MPPLGELVPTLPTLGTPFAFLAVFLWLYYHYFDRVLTYLQDRINSEQGLINLKLSKQQFHRRTLLILLFSYTLLLIIVVFILSMWVDKNLLVVSEWVQYVLWSICILIIIIAWGIVFIWESPRNAKPLSQKLISGNVFWEKSKRPVDGAALIILETGAEYKTNSSGHFDAFLSKTSKDLSISICWESVTKTIKLKGKNIVEPIIIYLPESSSLRGNVFYKTSDQPAIGVVISLDGEKDINCRTDQNGFFNLPVPIRKSYRIRVRHHGEALVSQKSLEEIQNPLEFFLSGKIKVFGNIYWSEIQEPVVGARINIDGQRGSWLSNVDGYFEILVDAQEKLILNIYSPDTQQSKSIDLDFCDDDHKGLRIQLIRDNKKKSDASNKKPPPKKWEAHSHAKGRFIEIIDLPGNYPQLEFIHIPAGDTLIGSNKEDIKCLIEKDDGGLWKLEIPQQKTFVDKFSISKTPITVGQFRAFVLGDGYYNPTYWDRVGWELKGDRTEPQKWNRIEWTSPDDLPVIGVSWYEADAYCKWLASQAKLPINLPSDEQWEKAARGTDGSRVYPWGNDIPSQLHANFGNNIGTTTPVSSYPLGASCYGVLDLSGNVWEWCSTSSMFDVSQFNQPSRILRGGCFNSNPNHLRSSFRMTKLATYANDYVGFRCVIN